MQLSILMNNEEYNQFCEWKEIQDTVLVKNYKELSSNIEEFKKFRLEAIKAFQDYEAKIRVKIKDDVVFNERHEVEKAHDMLYQHSIYRFIDNIKKAIKC
jgi:hypothetical protein